MTPPRTHPAWLSLAAERDDTGYDTGAASGVSEAGAWARVDRGAVLGGFARALEAVLELPEVGQVSEAAGDAVRAELEALSVARRRIDTRINRRIAELHRIEETLAKADAPDDDTADKAANRAALAVRRELRDRLGLTPSQVKAARAVGDRLAAAPALAEAMDAGTITAAHARILDRTLKPLGGPERERLEAELVEAASRLHVDEFRDHCTRRLAQLDLDAAAEAERRRHARRRAGIARTEDGMTALHGQWAGLQAEIVAAGAHAYTRPDAPGERRTAEQRFADGIADAMRVALEAGKAPTKHGVRPHIVITVDLDTLAERSGAAGVAEGEWTGPLIWPHVRRILDDSSVAFLAIGQDLPVAVTSEVRSVPAAVHKGLVLRDGGCIHIDCDLPAAWCQVMHLNVPHHKGGRLSFATGALGCTHHHRRYDDHRLELRWTDGRPTLHPPDT